MHRFIVAAAALAVLSGCSISNDGSSVDYKSAGTLPPLEVPPDLTSPARDNRYVVPETGALERHAFRLPGRAPRSRAHRRRAFDCDRRACCRTSSA